MSLNEDVDLDEFINQKDDLSGADIKAICSEAGLMALRERRMRVQYGGLPHRKRKSAKNKDRRRARRFVLSRQEKQEEKLGLPMGKTRLQHCLACVLVDE